MTDLVNRGEQVVIRQAPILNRVGGEPPIRQLPPLALIPQPARIPDNACHRLGGWCEDGARPTWPADPTRWRRGPHLRI